MKKSIVVVSIAGAVLAVGWCIAGWRARPDIDSFLAADRAAALQMEKDTNRLCAIALRDRDPGVRASAWALLGQKDGPTSRVPISLVRKICSEEPVDRVVKELLGCSTQDLFTYSGRRLELQHPDDRAALLDWMLSEEEWQCIPDVLQKDTNALVVLSEKAPSKVVRGWAMGALKRE